jgi:hypothetical protein
MLDLLKIPWVDYSAGLTTPFGTLLPPGGKVVAFVRSTGRQDNDPYPLSYPMCTTLAAALPYCRSGLGDVIIVLPGHSESVTDNTMMDNLVPGTRIIGYGWGSMQPTFRWTATAAQWILNDANVIIAGLHLRLEGASGVVKGIISTAAHNYLLNNRIQFASGASNKATIGIEVSTGADDFKIIGGKWYGSATNNVTDGVKVVAAVERCEIGNLSGQLSATAGNGLIHVTAAALGLDFHDLDLFNDHTDSTATIAVDDVAATGHFRRINSACINDGTATAQGITLGTSALIRCSLTYEVDEAKKNAILSPGVGT